MNIEWKGPSGCLGVDSALGDSSLALCRFSRIDLLGVRPIKL